jgi:hypothetical protein
MRDEGCIEHAEISSILKSLRHIYLSVTSELRTRAIEHVEKRPTSA